jgi:RNA-directed DNA polymerase
MADASIRILNDTFINKCNSKAYDKLKHTEAWQDKPWKQFQKIVFRLQKRIYQASKQGNKSLVHKLQRLLLTSRAAKYLAVRRVSQDNQGKRTPGIDGVALLNAKQKVALAESLILDAKAYPIRRILIPKPGKKEYRKLGIPTMRDRAKQALVKLTLEPEWEAKFEANSYGFRPGRSSHDAIAAVFSSIKQLPKYVLDADIEKCFDEISHAYLLDKLSTFSLLRRPFRYKRMKTLISGSFFEC